MCYDLLMLLNGGAETLRMLVLNITVPKALNMKSTPRSSSVDFYQPGPI